MGKVKDPIRAALARFLPIYNHLTNMSDFLFEAGQHDLGMEAQEFNRKLKVFEKSLKVFEKSLKAFEKSLKALPKTENRKPKTGV